MHNVGVTKKNIYTQKFQQKRLDSKLILPLQIKKKNLLHSKYLQGLNFNSLQGLVIFLAVQMPKIQPPLWSCGQTIFSCPEQL